MPKLKCKGCPDRFDRDVMIKVQLNWFHSFECASQYGQRLSRKKAANDTMRNAKALRSRQREAKAKIKKRTGKNGYYANLTTAIHYYVKHCLYPGADCYTCGNPQTPDNCHHAGHFIPAKETDPRRFMLENLRIQCYSCNSMNSGRRLEYRERLILEKGLDHVEWLECEVNHPNLLEVFPNVEDIQAETARYRKLARDFNKTGPHY